MDVICSPRQALTMKTHDGYPQWNADGLKLLSGDQDGNVGVMDGNGVEQNGAGRDLHAPARGPSFPTTDSPRLQALSQISVG